MLRKGLKRAAVFTCCAMLAAGTAGTAGAGNTAFGATFYKPSDQREEVKGRLYVSAGPDIVILYDKDGTVLEIRGVDSTGRKFLEGQDGYVGKSCREAMRRLVRRLDEKGWFDGGTSAPKHSLVIKAGKNSQYPRERFMEEIEDEVRDVARDRDLDLYIKVIGPHAVDDKDRIDKETAEKIVLELLGIKGDSLKIKEYDLDDGKYEIEVVIQGMEYEIELDAVTGEVLDIDRDTDHDGRYDDDDRDDDDRYDDDRYDDDRDDDDRDDDDWDDDDRDDDDRYDDDQDDDDHDDDDQDDNDDHDD